MHIIRLEADVLKERRLTHCVKNIHFDEETWQRNQRVEPPPMKIPI
jgi:hypothetical protein